jgi:phosphatidylglycerol:prolipoprotein diacylglycerol transferase
LFAAISYKPIPIYEIGPLSLSLHGVFAAAGFLVGGWLIVRQVRRRGFNPEIPISGLTWAVLFSLIGARLFTVPAHLGDPGYGLDDVFGVAGDFSILGGYAGGIIAGLWRMKYLGANIPAFADMSAAGLALGGVIGRIGDLAIVEHIGSATSFFLGYELKPGYDVAPQHDQLETLCETLGQCGPYHHTALYDLLGLAVLFGVLMLAARVWRGRYGQMFALWTAWYGMQRFFIDFTRLDAAKEGTVADAVMGPLTGSQWGGLATAALGVALFLWFRRNERVSAEGDVTLGAVPELVTVRL